MMRTINRNIYKRVNGLIRKKLQKKGICFTKKMIPFFINQFFLIVTVKLPFKLASLSVPDSILPNLLSPFA
ncbi:hypothetical protein [Fictibacillus enclensis]|uniref:hypothetical protein n=1 Tax=Fictibacillus enclensis TaxID=1017270 RepID=UPI0024BF7B3C|nr:hypothetical protein [Fictibacillus enclensis]WHY71222.1 hypothetical protein QNH15_19730 [Fictibacillus enclensis]